MMLLPIWNSRRNFLLAGSTLFLYLHFYQALISHCKLSPHDVLKRCVICIIAHYVGSSYPRDRIGLRLENNSSWKKYKSEKIRETVGFDEFGLEPDIYTESNKQSQFVIYQQNKRNCVSVASSSKIMTQNGLVTLKI